MSMCFCFRISNRERVITVLRSWKNIRIKQEESGWTGSDVNATLMMWVLYFSFPSRHTNQW